jgi:hypothetical protein
MMRLRRPFPPSPLPPGPGSAAGLHGLTPAAIGVLLALGGLGAPAALAQSESYLLGPGSNIGPSTRIRPVDCVTAADGSVTCKTVIENSPSDTPARPEVSPFKN